MTEYRRRNTLRHVGYDYTNAGAYFRDDLCASPPSRVRRGRGWGDGIESIGAHRRPVLG